MNLQEAYAAASAVAKSHQAVFFAMRCGWYDQPGDERRLSIEFQLSLVPGFACECDQWVSHVSLQSVVDQCLAAAVEHEALAATLPEAEAFVEQAIDLPVPEPMAVAPVPEDDIPW